MLSATTNTQYFSELIDTTYPGFQILNYGNGEQFIDMYATDQYLLLVKKDLKFVGYKKKFQEFDINYKDVKTIHASYEAFFIFTHGMCCYCIFSHH